MNEELRKKHLQQLDDASGIWHALKEVLDEATEMSVASAISDGVDSDDRHWRAGYAPGRSIESRVIVVLVIPLEYRP